MHLEQIYTLHQTYLENLHNYQFQFNAIDEQTLSETLGEYIAKELSTTAQEALTFDIDSLYKQLEYIVYLSKLFYYYAHSMNTLSSFNKYLYKNTYIQRLKGIWGLAQQKQCLFNNHLQLLIEGLSQEDTAAETLIENGIKYLNAICSSELSSEAEAANQSYLKIDIEKIKSQSDKDSKKLQAAFNKYIDRCSKGKQHKTPYTLTDNTIMPELKNDAFEEQAENSPTYSGNCSDDDNDSNKSFYSAIDQEMSSQYAVCTEEQHKPTIHVENQEQSSSNKNNLLTRLWGLLIRVWQHIKNTFNLFVENNDLNNTSLNNPSHPTPQQSTFEENMPPIATETKKPESTPTRVTNVPQTFFPDNPPTATSKQTNARTAEWVINHLPKFSKLY